MKQSHLLLEHRSHGQVIKRLKLTSKGRPIVLGANPKSDIRLVGQEVSQFHAVIESRSGAWYVYDFGSTTGTWVNKESIIEHKIETPIVVKVGMHELYLQPVEPQRDIFTLNKTEVTHKSHDFHQVILKHEKGVLESHLLPAHESFRLTTHEGVKEFQPPKSSEWVTHQIGKLVLQQRLTHDPGLAPKEKIKFDEQMKWPLTITSSVLLLLAIVIGLKPATPEAPKTLPELDNKYASMIYDAKVMAEKKKEATKVTEKKFTASQKGSQGSGETREIPKGAPATKLISQVKAQGLSQLIGKIAKRASANAQLVQGIGKTADEGTSGRALASIASSSVAGESAPGSALGKGFKLQGVGTQGKGGGGNYKEGTGLGVGNVGSADVGIVEEETEVGGGLDKDVIAEIIRSQLGQIRYCYERQLSASPDLYGKVMVRFTIGLDGAVAEQRIGTTTLKNADVEGCILRRVARWKFPNPKGGTSVLVTYPFLFKSTQ